MAGLADTITTEQIDTPRMRTFTRAEDDRKLAIEIALAALDIAEQSNFDPLNVVRLRELLRRLADGRTNASSKPTRQLADGRTNASSKPTRVVRVRTA